MNILNINNVSTNTETDENIIINIKRQRRYLLTESDWTQLPDVSKNIKDAWLSYRQELRDITLQKGFPLNVIWPTKPSE